MKRYLSLFFFILSGLILLIGYNIDVYWGGTIAWGLTFVSLCFAAYFTKYISNNEDEK